MRGFAIVLSALLVLLSVSSCGILRQATLPAEAIGKFPIGSNAADFEAWFATATGAIGKGSEASFITQPDQPRDGCVSKMATAFVPGACVSRLQAEYCVDAEGKVAALKVYKGGYC